VTLPPRFSTRPTSTGLLCAALLCLVLLFPVFGCRPAERTGDDFLAGYVASILERDLQWKRGSYFLKVVDGVATITLSEDDPKRREAAERQLARDRRTPGSRHPGGACRDGEAGISKPKHEGNREGGGFPTGDVFRPLIADPKQPRFFMSAVRFTSVGVTYTMAPVGFGETFGLYRLAGGREGDGLQFSVEGALFAQFNLSTPSYDLVNADYTIGIPGYLQAWRQLSSLPRLSPELAPRRRASSERQSSGTGKPELRIHRAPLFARMASVAALRRR